MKKITILGMFLLLPFLASCQTTDSTQRGHVENRTSQTVILKTELAALNLEDPKADMKRNFAHGDKRFISICGYVCYCPGIDKADYSLVKQFGSRIIQGTSDMMEPGEYGELYNSAKQYAERYNQALLNKLKN